MVLIMQGSMFHKSFSVVSVYVTEQVVVVARSLTISTCKV